MDTALKNAVREKILAGEKAFGTFFEIGGSVAVECLGYTGLDFFVIDSEHGLFDVESAAEFIRVAELAGITPFVRVKDSSRASVLKMLDVGAKGLIIPSIQSLDEIKKLVEFGKYYPVGQRGFAPTRVGGYTFRPVARNIESYFEICNRETLLLPQCETLGCLESIEEIAAVEGVDGIFVGPYDLSVALKKPAQFDDPEVVNAIARVRSACEAAGKFAFIYANTADASKKHFAEGFHGVACGIDAVFYANAYQRLVCEVKGA